MTKQKKNKVLSEEWAKQIDERIEKENGQKDNGKAFNEMLKRAGAAKPKKKQV